MRTPYETPPKHLLRDRDGTDGAEFPQRVVALGIEEKPTAPQAPWRNPYAERLIGTVRRECLDRVFVLGERHPHTILDDYFEYGYPLGQPQRVFPRGFRMEFFFTRRGKPR